jgi:hypothetical protein
VRDEKMKRKMEINGIGRWKGLPQRGKQRTKRNEKKHKNNASKDGRKKRILRKKRGFKGNTGK